jgi:predicted peroxiredoxin
MNIEISNEQIEQLIKKAVNERVKTWFGEPSNKYFIRDAIIKAVNVEVCKRVNESMIDIPKLASSLASKELAEKITDNIGWNIASIFAEKYGD